MASYRNTTNYIIYKTLASLSIVRWIEWPKMFEYLNDPKCEKILDVACGDGLLTTKIAEKGGNVVGIDALEDSIKSAKQLSKRLGIYSEFIIGDAERLPFSDKHFDVVVCSSSLEHFSDPTLSLREISRVLKKDGLVIMTIDSLNIPIREDLKKMHKKLFSVNNYYSPEQIDKLFGGVGIELCKHEYFLNSRFSRFIVQSIIIKCRRI